MGVPASVIVSSNSITAPAPAVHDSQLTDSWVGQSHSPSPGPSHMTAVVKQVDMPPPPTSLPPLCQAPPTCCCCCRHNVRVSSPLPIIALSSFLCISHRFHVSHSLALQILSSKRNNHSFACSFCVSLTSLCFCFFCKGMIIPVVIVCHPLCYF